MTTVAKMNLIITNYISALSDKEQLRFIDKSLTTTKVFPANPLGLARAVTLFMDTQSNKDTFKSNFLKVTHLMKLLVKNTCLYLKLVLYVKVRELQQIVSWLSNSY